MNGYLLTKQEQQCISTLLNIPENSDWALYNRLIEQELITLLDEHLTKYHSGVPRPQYYTHCDNNRAWYAYESSIAIPIGFIAHLIKHHVHKTSSTHQTDMFFWQNIAAFHHEITHIKNQHIVQRKALYGDLTLDTLHALHEIYKNDTEKVKMLIAITHDFLIFCQKKEWEADEGIPNHRLMLSAMRLWSLQEASEQDRSNIYNYTHPLFEDRANRFGQRLEILLKQRAQTVSRTFGLDKLPKIPAPQHMPNVPSLLNIESEHYESILDFIGENKAA